MQSAYSTVPDDWESMCMYVYPREICGSIHICVSASLLERQCAYEPGWKCVCPKVWIYVWLYVPVYAYVLACIHAHKAVVLGGIFETIFCGRSKKAPGEIFALWITRLLCPSFNSSIFSRNRLSSPRVSISFFLSFFLVLLLRWRDSKYHSNQLLKDISEFGFPHITPPHTHKCVFVHPSACEDTFKPFFLLSHSLLFTPLFIYICICLYFSEAGTYRQVDYDILILNINFSINFLYTYAEEKEKHTSIYISPYFNKIIFWYCYITCVLSEVRPIIQEI